MTPAINAAGSSAASPPEQHGSAPADPDQWVDQYGDFLFRYAVIHLPQREAAEDLVQETFLAAWRGRAQYGGQAKFETWLISILKNKIRDRLRGRRRDPVSLDDAIEQAASAGGAAGELFDGRGHWLQRPARWPEAPEASVEKSEFWSVLGECMARLPQHFSEALRLKLATSESNKEISQTLGVSPANLSVRLHRARLLLRDCLQKRWFHD